MAYQIYERSGLMNVCVCGQIESIKVTRGNLETWLWVDPRVTLQSNVNFNFTHSLGLGDISQLCSADNTITLSKRGKKGAGKGWPVDYGRAEDGRGQAATSNTLQEAVWSSLMCSAEVSGRGDEGGHPTKGFELKEIPFTLVLKRRQFCTLLFCVNGTWNWGIKPTWEFSTIRESMRANNRGEMGLCVKECQKGIFFFPSKTWIAKCQITLQSCQQLYNTISYPVGVRLQSTLAIICEPQLYWTKNKTKQCITWFCAHFFLWAEFKDIQKGSISLKHCLRFRPRASFPVS